MKSALLDSNFLLAPYQFRINVVDEIRKLGFEPITLSCIVKELTSISRRNSKDGKAARIALEILEKEGISVVEFTGDADRSLEKYALENNSAVATNDKILIGKLKKKGVEVIRLKQKKIVSTE